MNHFIHLPGYSMVNNNQKTKNGGGVGMFISSALKFRDPNYLNLQKDDIPESIFIETCLEENEKIIVGTVYKPPSNNFNDFETKFFLFSAKTPIILHAVFN